MTTLVSNMAIAQAESRQEAPGESDAKNIKGGQEDVISVERFLKQGVMSKERWVKVPQPVLFFEYLHNKWENWIDL